MPRTTVFQVHEYNSELDGYGLLNVTNFPVHPRHGSTLTAIKKLVPNVEHLGQWSDTNGHYTLITMEGEIWMGGKIGEVPQELIDKICPEGYEKMVYLNMNDHVPHIYWLGRKLDQYEHFDHAYPGDPPPQLLKEWEKLKDNKTKGKPVEIRPARIIMK